MFRHPSYYKNLRKLARNSELHVRPQGSEACDTAQAISPTRATALQEGVRLVRAPSNKLQAPSSKILKQQATSIKLQGTSVKLKATSNKLLDSRTTEKFQAP